MLDKTCLNNFISFSHNFWNTSLLIIFLKRNSHVIRKDPSQWTYQRHWSLPQWSPWRRRKTRNGTWPPLGLCDCPRVQEYRRYLVGQRYDNFQSANGCGLATYVSHRLCSHCHLWCSLWRRDGKPYRCRRNHHCYLLGGVCLRLDRRHAYGKCANSHRHLFWTFFSHTV